MPQASQATQASKANDKMKSRLVHHLCASASMLLAQAALGTKALWLEKACSVICFAFLSMGTKVAMGTHHTQIG